MEDRSLVIFHETQQIQIDTPEFEREEEVEDQEDQERHNTEIKNLLCHAFDDLDNEYSDNDSSINSISFLENNSNLPLLPSSQSCSNIEPIVSNDNCILDSELLNSLQNSDCNINENFLCNKLTYEKILSNYYASNNKRLSDFSVFNISKNNKEFNEGNKSTRCFSTFETPSNHFSNHKLAFKEKFLQNNYINTSYDELLGFNTFEGLARIDEHIEKISHSQPISKNKYYNSFYQNKDQLNVLNIVRIREIEKLSEDVKQLEKEKEEITILLKEKLSLAEMEIKRLNISADVAQKALVDAKTKITDLQLKISTLENVKRNLEKSKSEITEELMITKKSIFELQQKVFVLEDMKLLKINEVSTKKCLLEERKSYDIQLQKMQLQIEAITQEFCTKNVLYVSLEQIFFELYKLNTLLKSKSTDTINMLFQMLEENNSELSHVHSEEFVKLCYELEIVFYKNTEILKRYDKLKKELNYTEIDFNYNSIIKDDTNNKIPAILQLRQENIMNEMLPSVNRFSQIIFKKEFNKYITPDEIIEKKIDSLQEIALYYENKLQILVNIYIKEMKLFAEEYNHLINTQSFRELNQLKNLFYQLNNVVKELDQLQIEKEQLLRRLSKSCMKQNKLYILCNDFDVDSENVSINQKENVTSQDIEGAKVLQQSVKKLKKESERIIQLSIDLQETRNELNYVKELYIDICATKENLVIYHINQLKYLINKYQNYRVHREFNTFKQNIKVHFSLIRQMLEQQDKQLRYCYNFEEKLLNIKVNTEIHKNIIPIREDIPEAIKKFVLKNLDPTKYDEPQNDCSSLIMLKIQEVFHLIIKNFSFEPLENQLSKTKIIASQISIPHNSHLKEMTNILENRINFTKAHLNVILQIKKNKKLELIHKVKVKELEKKINNLKKLQSGFNKNQVYSNMMLLKLSNHEINLFQFCDIQHKIFREFNYRDQNNDLLEIHYNRESTLEKIQKLVKRHITTEVKFIKSYYKQKIKVHQEKYEKVILLLKHQLKRKEIEFLLHKDKVSTEKLKMNNYIEEKEKIILKLIEAKFTCFQKEITYKTLEMHALQNKLQQTENDLEDDRNVMAQVMSQWINEIKKIYLKTSKLEDKIKCLYMAKKNYVTHNKEK